MSFNFNLNMSINNNGLWPSVKLDIEVENTIQADIEKLQQNVKMAILDMAEARIVEAKALISAKSAPVDERAELLAEIARLEAEIKGRQPVKKGPGRPKKIRVDHSEMDSQELRDYMAGKDSLRPDPIF